MSKIKGLIDDEMPREKLIKFGPSSLSEVDLLAIILRTGTKDKNVIELSREILSKFKTNVISRKTFEELVKIKGISKAKASQIVALFELSRRFDVKGIEENVKLNSSKIVYDYIKNEYINLGIEKVMLILVNSKNKIIRKEFIFEGSINFSFIDKRKIVKKVFDYDASGFFLIHNHPSGDILPSKEDLIITKELKKISDNLDIKFLDHLIIGEGFYSMYDRGDL